MPAGVAPVLAEQLVAGAEQLCSRAGEQKYRSDCLPLDPFLPDQRRLFLPAGCCGEIGRPAPDAMAAGAGQRLLHIRSIERNSNWIGAGVGKLEACLAHVGCQPEWIANQAHRSGRTARQRAHRRQALEQVGPVFQRPGIAPGGKREGGDEIEQAIGIALSRHTGHAGSHCAEVAVGKQIGRMHGQARPAGRLGKGAGAGPHNDQWRPGGSRAGMLFGHKSSAV